MSAPTREFGRRVAHDRPGTPDEVLRIERYRPRDLQCGELLIEVVKSPIHPGDLQLIAAPSDDGARRWPRVPGLEAAGVIADAGPGALAEHDLRLGARVAFFAPSAWQSHAIVPAGSVRTVPPGMSDDVAAQVLVNTITARHVLRAAGRCRGRLIQSGASSAVGKLISAFAMEYGHSPIRLVRSRRSAERLAEILPGGDIVDTSADDWRSRVRDLAEGEIGPIVDGVGGTLLVELARLASAGERIVSYGRLDAEPIDHSIFISKGLSLSGLTIGTWSSRTSREDRTRDLRSAMAIGLSAPRIFGEALSYPVDDLPAAIAAATSPDRSGNVLLDFRKANP